MAVRAQEPKVVDAVVVEVTIDVVHVKCQRIPLPLRFDSARLTSVGHSHLQHRPTKELRLSPGTAERDDPENLLRRHSKLLPAAGISDEMTCIQPEFADLATHVRMGPTCLWSSQKAQDAHD
jgi:hypothetical protein